LFEIRSNYLAQIGSDEEDWIANEGATPVAPVGIFQRKLRTTMRSFLLMAAEGARSDIFAFFEQCQTSQVDFCIRMMQNRRLEDGSAEEPRRLLDEARQWPARGERSLDIPARAGQSARKKEHAGGVGRAYLGT
jgi:hypothetical protein